MQLSVDSKELVRQAGEFADNEQPDAAMDLCNQVLLQEPDNVGALFVAACVFLQAARHLQAIQTAKRITALCPKDPRGWTVLSQAFGELHRYDESLRYAQTALDCRRSAKTLEGMAYAYVNAGDWEQGERYAREAIKLATGDDSRVAKEAGHHALVHLTYARLGHGDWKFGFEGYRRTMRTKWRKEREYVGPDGEVSKEWNGEEDAVLIVTGEQGLGDEIMAAGMVPDACKRVKKFIFDCDHRLQALFARSFPDAIITPSRRQEAVRTPIAPTHHKTLFGLAEVLRQHDRDFPRKPYLVPNPDYVRMFKALLGENAIGIAWSGGLPRTGMEQRKAGLFSFISLLRKGGNFVSLEYKDDAAEVAEMQKRHGIQIRRLPWVTQAPDMDLLAGCIAACQSVVGVHTSALHLASALGVPTTMLAHRGSGWRYGPSEMLWYPPTTQVKKKRVGESWRELVERL